MRKLCDVDEVWKCLDEGTGDDSVYAKGLLEWAIKKRTIDEADIRADERQKVLDEVIEKIKSGEHCSPSACKHYYEISDHFIDSDCTQECEDSIIEMIEQMKGEQT